MRILQVNTSDIGGGAAQVAWNLLTAYRDKTLESWLAVGYKYSADDDVLAIPRSLEGWRSVWDLSTTRGLSAALQAVAHDLWPPTRWAWALARGVGRFRSVLGHEDFSYPGSRKLLDLVPAQPDIVHCHNLHRRYFDLRVLPSLSHRVPLVFTLHDAWLLSGHCAHSFGCERWKTGCGECPDLTIPPEIGRDATARNWTRKRRIYAESRMYVATPCSWLMKKVERSMLAPALLDARVIPNGVDLSTFRPGDQRVARRACGTPLDAVLLLAVGSQFRSSRWKDYDTLRAVVSRVAEVFDARRVLCVVLGDTGSPESAGRGEIRFVPYARERSVVADHYRAADVYLHPALADTHPNAVLESLACGTPVVAVSVGGIPEQIQDGVDGFLVPPSDAVQMAARAVQLLSDVERRDRMARCGVSVARKCFDLAAQVNRYLTWYGDILASWPTREQRARAGAVKGKPCAAQS